jgi:hypothetical protein
MNPLQTTLLHPSWGSVNGPGEEIDGRADAEHHRSTEAVLVSVGPEFLFGSTQANDDQLCPGVSDFRDDAFGPGGVAFESARRTQPPYDLDTGKQVPAVSYC